MNNDWTVPQKPKFIPNYRDWPQETKDKYYDLLRRRTNGERLGLEDFAWFMRHMRAKDRFHTAKAHLRVRKEHSMFGSGQLAQGSFGSAKRH